MKIDRVQIISGRKQGALQSVGRWGGGEPRNVPPKAECSIKSFPESLDSLRFWKKHRAWLAAAPSTAL